MFSAEFATLKTFCDLCHDCCMEIKGDVYTEWLESDYPRPMMCRSSWTSLNGQWEFFADRAAVCDFPCNDDFSESITVPYPPGSPLSGLTDPDVDVDTVWYRRFVSADEIESAGTGEKLFLHFEAVDHAAQVWVNGHLVVQHEGGYTPFSAEISAIPDVYEGFTVIVKATDHRSNIHQPRGKQDWRDEAHGIWYERSTGIWRDVWLERAARTSIKRLSWSTNIDECKVSCFIELNNQSSFSHTTEIVLKQGEEEIAHVTSQTRGHAFTIDIPIAALANKVEWDTLLWSPESPHLVDAMLTVTEETTGKVDEVISYLGIRSVDLRRGYLELNQEPIFVRAVLDQGYWAESYFTAPSPESLRQDMSLIKSLGFNTARIHQRTPDRRYLAWADRLGVMVWAEFASAFAFDLTAIDMLTQGWSEVIRRDISHPSIVVWVPFNESWGVPGIVAQPQQQAFVKALVEITRAYDPSRPVIANDGWEQLDPDIVTIHDYGTTGTQLRVNYLSEEAVKETLRGPGPQGRKILLTGTWEAEKPLMVSEFGGISLQSAQETDAWGYEVVASVDEYEATLRELFEALYASPIISGVCYTQLTDTRQETNGLCYKDRVPKLPLDTIREIVDPYIHFVAQQRPRIIREVEAQQR